MGLSKEKLSAALNTAREKPVIEIFDRDGELIVRTTLQALIREALPAVLKAHGPLAIVFGDVLLERVDVRRFPELSERQRALLKNAFNHDPDAVGEGG